MANVGNVFYTAFTNVFFYFLHVFYVFNDFFYFHLNVYYVYCTLDSKAINNKVTLIIARENQT